MWVGLRCLISNIYDETSWKFATFWSPVKVGHRHFRAFFEVNSASAMIEKTFNSKPAAKAESTGLGIDASKIGESMVSQAGNEAVDKSANNNAADGEDHDEENNENEDSSLKDDQASNESRMPNENEMSTIAKHIPTENLKDLAVQLDFKDEEIDFLMKVRLITTSKSFCQIGGLHFQSVQYTSKFCSIFFGFGVIVIKLEGIKSVSECSGRPDELTNSLSSFGMIVMTPLPKHYRCLNRLIGSLFSLTGFGLSAITSEKFWSFWKPETRFTSSLLYRNVSKMK